MMLCRSFLSYCGPVGLFIGADGAVAGRRHLTYARDPGPPGSKFSWHGLAPLRRSQWPGLHLHPIHASATHIRRLRKALRTWHSGRVIPSVHRHGGLRCVHGGRSSVASFGCSAIRSSGVGTLDAGWRATKVLRSVRGGASAPSTAWWFYEVCALQHHPFPNCRVMLIFATLQLLWHCPFRPMLVVSSSSAGSVFPRRGCDGVLSISMAGVVSCMAELWNLSECRATKVSRSVCVWGGCYSPLHFLGEFLPTPATVVVSTIRMPLDGGLLRYDSFLQLVVR